MKILEVLHAMQDVEVEIHVFKNFKSPKVDEPVSEIIVLEGKRHDVCVELYRKEYEQYSDAEVFFIGFSNKSSRSRIIRINCCIS